MSFTALKPEPVESRVQPIQSGDCPSLRGRCTTVALIGPDGSGKSAVAQALMNSSPVPLKYLYMGTSIESANVTLPTSRWVHQWKVWRHRKSLEASGKNVPQKITLHGLEHRSNKRGKLGAALRLLRRISEESYRQLHSWIYQWQGKVVLYDRHFLFDGCPAPGDGGDHRLNDRIHYWFLRRLYPRPDIAIFLDAPADVLYSRKQEVPLVYLERERQTLLTKQSYAKCFISVDCTRPLDEVVTRIEEILKFYCPPDPGRSD